MPFCSRSRMWAMKLWAAPVITLVLAVCAPVCVVAAQPVLAPPAHVVIVVEENHSYEDVVANKSAPYINFLADNGTLMTQSFAVTHPSEPNYMALFAGDTFGLTSDACPVNAGSAPNLASEVMTVGLTFAGFSEGLPAVGATVCSAGKYARKHAPWVNFTNVPADASLPFDRFNVRGDYASLPTVSFVIPNLDNDMHDGSIAQADRWLEVNLSGYANWAKANNSLLIVTWDEDDNGPDNHIATLFYGAHVPVARHGGPVNHYNMLSTLEGFYGLPKTGSASASPPIVGIWA